jgi:replication factor C large subunit
MEGASEQPGTTSASSVSADGSAARAAKRLSQIPWVHTYSPKRIGDVVGHERELAQVKRYLETYKPGQKPLLLIGRSGVGKTSIVYALAHELDLELLEINASDTRNKDAIQSIVGGAAAQQSLFFRKKVILLDEIDGLSGTQDRGGIPALVALFSKSRHPIICTASDATEDKLKPLIKASVVVPLELTHEQVLTRLSHIATREAVDIQHEHLTTISRRSGADLRSAINNLQSLHTGIAVTKDDVDLLTDRDARDEIQQGLLRVFKTSSADVALPAFQAVDEDVDTLMLWIDENLPRAYTHPDDLARALDALAEANKFFGRIRRWQYYRYYVYIYDLLTAGIATAKEHKYPGTPQFERPNRILKMWIYNQKNAKRKALSLTLAPHLHTSSKRIRHDVLPFLKIACKDKKTRAAVIAQYDLDDDAAEWLGK